MATDTPERLVLPVDTILSQLNDDPEFKLSARYWNCDIRFVIGGDPYFMHIENGKVTNFQQGTQGHDPYHINISAPEEVWERMLEAIPKPFYHDWFAASAHHELDFSGDLESAYAYYYALRRIKAVMGETVRSSRLG
jgi:hypothetical protein